MRSLIVGLLVFFSLTSPGADARFGRNQNQQGFDVGFSKEHNMFPSQWPVVLVYGRRYSLTDFGECFVKLYRPDGIFSGSGVDVSVSVTWEGVTYSAYCARTGYWGRRAVVTRTKK